jgi:hypothetical protein
MESNGPDNSLSLFDGEGFSDPQLRTLYEHSTGPIAYIDESYRSPAQARGNGFYILTAVVLERDRVVHTRAKLREIAQTHKWHTTNEALTEHGRKKILKMSRHLASAALSVLAVQSKITAADKDTEQARYACFDTLLGDMCARTQQLQVTGLVVLERRRDTRQRNADDRTIHRLRHAGTIHRELVVHQGSPGGESLLWAPDVVSWSARQSVTMNNKVYLEPLAKARTIRMILVP